MGLGVLFTWPVIREESAVNLEMNAQRNSLQ
jgi:hypothetical protein